MVEQAGAMRKNAAAARWQHARGFQVLRLVQLVIEGALAAFILSG